MDKNYDIVIDVLQKHIDILQNMIEKNLRADMINIMDYVRIDQINDLEIAIKMWETYKQPKRNNYEEV